MTTAETSAPRTEFLAQGATLGVILTWRLPDDTWSTRAREEPDVVTPVLRSTRFFDEGLFQPLLRVGSDERHAVADGVVPGVTAGLQVQCFVHTLGFATVIVKLDLDADLTMDDLIGLTNRLSSLDFELPLKDGSVFRLRAAFKEAADGLSAEADDDEPAVSPYTFIHIHRIRGVGEQPGVVYEAYEREFHALAARVVLDWRRRFPAGVHYDETNAAVAPTGVIRFNARNTLIFEYPYSRTDVEELYYLALVELRLWHAIAANELLRTKDVAHRIRSSSSGLRFRSELLELREQALRVASDFEILSVCTSKRTTRFYEVGMREFSINEMLTTARERLVEVDRVLSGISTSVEARRERELLEEQRAISANSESASEKSSGVTAVLSLLGVLVAVQLALDIGSTFEWSATAKIIAAGVALLAVLLFGAAVNRSVSRRSSTTIMTETTFDSKLSSHEMLDLILSRHSASIRAVKLSDDGAITVSARDPSSRGGDVRAYIEVADRRGRANAYTLRCEVKTPATGSAALRGRTADDLVRRWGLLGSSRP